MKHTPIGILGKYPGCSSRQIARLMCRAVSKVATDRHSVGRFDLAEQMIAEAMDLTEWATEDERAKVVAYLREAVAFAETPRAYPRPHFKPLP